MHYDADAVQEATANAFDEIKQLKATKFAPMEEMRCSTGDDDEIVQLKAMVQELRDELEKFRFDADDPKPWSGAKVAVEIHRPDPARRDGKVSF